MDEIEHTPICCDEAKAAEIKRKIERHPDGLYVNGCCGGGCFVLSRLRFCPFCGKKVL